MKRNIVLIVADQFRGDCLGFAGHPDVKTPYLDTLAAQGLYCPAMYSACPSCIPARAALMTGLSQERNGRVGYADGQPWNYAHTLAGELAKLGYYTQCVGKMHVHPPRKLLGFHNVELHDGFLHHYRREDTPACQAQSETDDYLRWARGALGNDFDMDDAGVQCNSWLARPWPRDEKYHPTRWVTDRAIDFLRRRDRDMPFFLNVSYVRPHPPFDAPACFFDFYRQLALRPPARGDWDDLSALEQNGRVKDALTGPCDPALIREAQIGYYACVTHLDQQIGRLLERLPPDTAVIFTSDHGEMLCDHGLFRKGLPYDGSARVPLIINVPGRRAGVLSRLGELRDILPTLVYLAGGETPAFSDGENLLSDAAGREYLHGEHAYGEKSNHYIVTKSDKYIWYSQTGVEQYFDLARDPRETHNKIGDAACQKRVAYLREKLIARLSGREEGYVRSGALVTGRAVKTRLAAPESEEGKP